MILKCCKIFVRTASTYTYYSITINASTDVDTNTRLNNVDINVNSCRARIEPFNKIEKDTKRAFVLALVVTLLLMLLSISVLI